MSNWDTERAGRHPETSCDPGSTWGTRLLRRLVEALAILEVDGVRD